MAIAVAVSVAATAVHADLPSVRFDRLHPVGAGAGTTVEVEIAGAEIDGVAALLFDHAGLKAEHVKERTFRISVAGDVPAGTYDVRLVGRWGVSNPRLFAVSHGFADVAEKEPNNATAQAQAVAVNSAVNGMSDGNAEDVFKVPLKKGQRVVIDCQAGKLDSMLDGVLTLSAADGRQVASNSDYTGRDPLIDFVAPADGDYLIALHDLSYRGGQPYRLIITDRPSVENVFPRAVETGKPAELTLLGRNFGGAGSPSTAKIEELTLEERKVTVTAPTDVTASGAYRFLEHPTDHTVLPTAATCTLTGFQYRADFDGPAFGATPLLVSESPVTIEAEPNDDREKPQALQLPAVVSGRFDQPRDADWFEIEIPEGENGQYAFDVYSERIAGQADPYVVVIDANGNRAGELDDFGHRMNAFDGHLRDPAGMINLNAKQKYRVLVQDRYQRGGPRYQYVLTIRKPVPDFYAAVIHHHNPGPGGTTVFRGGAQYLDVIIHQREGYNGPMTITAENLPPGLHAAPTTISNNSRGTFVLWADVNAADWTGTIRLVATGKRGDAEFRREVRPYTRVWNGGDGSSRPTRELAVAIRDSAPYALAFAPERIEVEAGQKAALKLQLKRLWPEFKNPLTVLPSSFPGNFQMGNLTIAPDQSEIAAEILVQAGTRPGEYTLNVLGQGQVPFSRKPDEASKPNTLVSLPSRPVTIVVREAKGK